MNKMAVSFAPFLFAKIFGILKVSSDNFVVISDNACMDNKLLFIKK